MKVFNMEGDGVGADSLSRTAQITIYGWPVDEFEDRKHVDKRSMYDPINFYTVTKFKVKEVIKNTTKVIIKKGDIYNVIEPITLVQKINGKTVYKLNSYEPMKKNVKYFAYLCGSDGHYYVVKYEECAEFHVCSGILGLSVGRLS